MQHRRLGIICTSQGWGELEINTLKLCEWIRVRGWRVHLLSAPNADLDEKADSIPNSITTLGLKSIPKKTKQLRLVHQWVMQHKLEVLLVTNYKAIAIASIYKRFLNRDIALVYLQQEKLQKSKRDLIHTLRFKMIDKWIVCSEESQTATLRLTRLPDEKVVLMPEMETSASFETAAHGYAAEKSELIISKDQITARLTGLLEDAINAPDGLDFLESLKD